MSKKKANKLILFDWGNIVESYTTGYSCRKAWDDLFKACGYKGKERAYTLVHPYKVSSITSIKKFEKIYEHMAKEFYFKTTYSEFIELYKKTFDKVDYYEDVAKYERSLKSRCYIGIFSNLNVFDKERLDKQVGLSNYDYVFLSYEMGLRKPDKKIYEKVIEQLPFSNENILFIDDRQNNIDVANEFGWNTLQATGLELEKIKSHCDKFIKEGNPNK